MPRDEAIKYNSLYQEVLLAISNIKNLGFDTSEFENSLKTIHNDVNNNVKVNYVKGMAEASYIQSYTTGINELNKLKIKLDNYNIYMSAYSTCNYINMLLKDNISKRELEKCISKMIAVLKNINKSRTIDYDNERHIVEKIYETAYNVIKLEIMMTGDSQLYLFVKNEDTNISYFNGLIIKDIETIDLENEENKNIKTKMFELGQNGIYSNYLDLGLIKLILLANGNLDIKKAINDNAINLANEIDANIEKIRSKTKDITEKKEITENIGESLIRKIKDARKRVVSSILTIALVISGGIGAAKLAKNVSENGGYIKYTQIMTSDGAKYNNANTEVTSNEYKDDEVTVKVSQKDGNEYKYQEYDISDINLNSIEEYYDYALKNYAIDLENGSLEIKRDSYQLKKPLDEAILMVYGMYIILLMLLELFSIGKMSNDDVSWYHYIKIKKILEDTKKINEEKDDLTAHNKELNDYYDEMMNYIYQDEKIRNRFNTLYEENKFLLDNPDELYNKVNNISNLNKVKEAKKLIREKK